MITIKKNTKVDLRELKNPAPMFLNIFIFVSLIVT